MKKRIIALISALVVLLMFFTACGNGGTQQTDKPQTKEPQLVVALNPKLVYGDDTVVVPYNDINKAMGADSQSSSLTAITDTAWTWAHGDDEGWVERAVYGFGRWKSGAGTQAKGVFAYGFTDAGSTSLGVYNTKSNELVTYQDEELPEAGMLLSAVAGAEEGLHYTVSQDGTVSIPSGTITAIEQVAGVKTGFLAEDGTARSASIRIVFNDAQIWSGTLCNSTASEDGVAVTQLTYPQFDDLPVKAGNTLLITMELNAQANSDEDITKPDEGEIGGWQVVRKSTQVTVPVDNTPQDSDVTTDDGSIKTIMNYQFTFTIVRDAKYAKIATSYAETIMKRTGAEVVTGREGKEAKYELVFGVNAERPESKKIYDEIVTARVDNVTDYVIRLVGTKLYVVGANDDALQAAMDYFLETFVKDDKGKVPAKYNYYNKPAHVMYTIAGENIATYTIRTERYPSLIVQKAAESIQAAVQADCGYLLPIKAMNLAGNDLGKNEIRVGPMNGAMKVDRVYNTRFTSGTWQNYMQIDGDGMLVGDDSYWQVNVADKNVLIEGGEAHSVSAGAIKFLADLKANKGVAASYKKSGNYVSAYDWKDMYGYEKVDFSLPDGYGLVWSEDWNYSGTDKEIEKEALKYWNVSNAPSTAGESDPDHYAYNPRIYGRNWWIAADTAGNGYLFETTLKRSTAMGDADDHAYEMTRVISEGKMGFRYGIWEQRMVMGTRYGASSSIWCATAPPYERVGGYLEIDVYENYGRDCFVPCTHHNQDGTYLGNYHFMAPYYQEPCWLTPNEGENFYDTFHHITVDWTYDYINFYFDGKCVSTMPMFNYEEFKYYRTGVTLRFAMGAGNLQYCNMNEKGEHGKLPSYVPEYWTALDGVDLNRFFELQLIDYSRIYQTDNNTIDSKPAENEMKFTSAYGR